MTKPVSSPYLKTGKKIFTAKKRIEAAAKKEYDQIQSEDPFLARNIKMVTTVRGFKKKPEGYRDVSCAVFAHLTRPKGLAKTQAEITKDVAKTFPPEFNITPNIWQRKLPSYEKKVIVDMAKELYPKLNLRGCDTLSKIRQRFQEYKSKSIAETKLSADIVIDGGKLIVSGKKTYKIEKKKLGDYEYSLIRVDVNSKRVVLRIDALEAMLS